MGSSWQCCEYTGTGKEGRAWLGRKLGSVAKVNEAVKNEATEIEATTWVNVAYEEVVCRFCFVVPAMHFPYRKFYVFCGRLECHPLQLVG